MGKNCQTQKEPNKQAPAAALSEAVLLLWLRVRDSQSVLLSQDTDDETWRQHSRGPGSSAAASAGAAGAPHGETAPPARCAAAGGTHNLSAPRPALRRGLAGAPNCACPVGRRGGGKTSAQSEACPHPGRRRRPQRPQLVPWAGLPGAAGGAGGGRRASRAGSERGHVSRPDAHSGTAATAPSCPTSWSRPQPSEARRHITLCGTRVRRGHDPLTSQVTETACLTGCDAGLVGLSGASSFPLCACAQHFNTDQGQAKEADAPVPRPRAR